MAERPEALRLPPPRRAGPLRLQPDPAAGQPRGRRRLAAAAAHRRPAGVQAHAEGAQPHHAGPHVRRHALRVRGVLGAHVLVSDLDRDRWVNAVLAGINASLACYAIVAYIGVCNSIVDVWTNVVSWLYKPQRTPRGQARRSAARGAATVADAPAAHWSQTLAYASADGVRRAERRRASPAAGYPGDRRSPLGDRRAARTPPAARPPRRDRRARAGTRERDRDEHRPASIPAGCPTRREPQLSPLRVVLALLVVPPSAAAGSSPSARSPRRSGRAAEAAPRTALVRPVRRRDPDPDRRLPGPRREPGRRRRPRLRRGRQTADARAPRPGARTRRSTAPPRRGPRPPHRAGARPGRRRDRLLRRPGQHRARRGLRRPGELARPTGRSSTATRRTVDFDIEGAALADTAANVRRATAVEGDPGRASAPTAAASPSG